MEQFSDIRQSVVEVLGAFVQTLIGMIPKAITGLVVLLLGLAIAKIVQRMIRLSLTRMKFDELIARIGADRLLTSLGMRGSPARGIARAVYYLLVILFVQATAAILGLDAVTDAIAAFFGYLPSLVAALLIVFLGNAVGQFARKAVEESGRESGLDYAPALGRAVSAVIGFVVAIMAIAQLGIDTEMIRTIVVVTLAGGSLAFALSFGLGSRDITHNIVAGFYVRKVFEVGEPVELEGARGTLEAVTATQTLLDDQGTTVAVPNRVMLDKAVRQG